MDRHRIARVLVAASGPAALWIAGLELLSLGLAHAPAASELAWLGLTTLVLSFGGCLLVALMLIGVIPLLPGAVWLASKPAVLRALGASALALSVALHAANALLYVRLYMPLHAALAASVLGCSLAGFALLRAARRQDEARLGLGKLIAAAAVFLLLLGATLAHTLTEPSLRALALEDSTQLVHEVRALHLVTGLLDVAPAEPAGTTLDPEILAAVEPQPVTQPSGIARSANVVLVTIDSMRFDRWLAGGAARPLMPELERLAGDSTRFTYAYAPSCWTIHSMGATLFGTLPSFLPVAYLGVSPALEFIENKDGEQRVRDPLTFKKVTPVPAAARATTLIDALNEGGYETATVAAYIYYFRGAGLTADFTHVDEQGYRALGVGPSGLAHVPMVERTDAWLDQRAGDRPFFLWLHFMEPHAPYEARDAEAEGQDAVARYDSELRYVDGELARLRASLERRGLWPSTMMIVHADHGEEFGDHGGSFHATTLYDETVRVPLLIRLPGQSGGRTVATPVSLLDLGPTVLDVAGVASKGPTMGRSLRPALQGQALPERPIIMECDRFAAHKRAYLRWPFKLILDQANHTAQLYALPSDPLERDNLAGRQSELAQGLALELGALMNALGAP